MSASRKQRKTLIQAYTVCKKARTAVGFRPISFPKSEPVASNSPASIAFAKAAKKPACASGTPAAITAPMKSSTVGETCWICLPVSQGRSASHFGDADKPHQSRWGILRPGQHGAQLLDGLGAFHKTCHQENGGEQDLNRPNQNFHCLEFFCETMPQRCSMRYPHGACSTGVF